MAWMLSRTARKPTLIDLLTPVPAVRAGGLQSRTKARARRLESRPDQS